MITCVNVYLRLPLRGYEDETIYRTIDREILETLNDTVSCFGAAPSEPLLDYLCSRLENSTYGIEQLRLLDLIDKLNNVATDPKVLDIVRSLFDKTVEDLRTRESGYEHLACWAFGDITRDGWYERLACWALLDILFLSGGACKETQDVITGAKEWIATRIGFEIHERLPRWITQSGQNACTPEMLLTTLYLIENSTIALVERWETNVFMGIDRNAFTAKVIDKLNCLLESNSLNIRIIAALISAAGELDLNEQPHSKLKEIGLGATGLDMVAISPALEEIESGGGSCDWRAVSLFIQTDWYNSNFFQNLVADRVYELLFLLRNGNNRKKEAAIEMVGIIGEPAATIEILHEINLLLVNIFENYSDVGEYTGRLGDNILEKTLETLPLLGPKAATPSIVDTLLLAVNKMHELKNNDRALDWLSDMASKMGKTGALDGFTKGLVSIIEADGNWRPKYVAAKLIGCISETSIPNEAQLALESQLGKKWGVRYYVDSKKALFMDETFRIKGFRLTAEVQKALIFNSKYYPAYTTSIIRESVDQIENCTDSFLKHLNVLNFVESYIPVQDNSSLALVNNRIMRRRDLSNITDINKSLYFLIWPRRLRLVISLIMTNLHVRLGEPLADWLRRVRFEMKIKYSKFRERIFRDITK